MNVHAVTTMATRPTTLKHGSFYCCTRLRRGPRVSESKSIHHHRSVSKQPPTMASPDASPMSVRVQSRKQNSAVECPVYLPPPGPPPHLTADARTTGRRETRAAGECVHVSSLSNARACLPRPVRGGVQLVQHAATCIL